MSELIYISLFCTGLFVAMNAKGMLLVPVANFLSTYLPEWICKPIFECLVCMSSVWTVVFWTVFVQKDYWHIIPAMFIVAGLNTIIYALINVLFDE